jgi:hypothetical protein
MGVTIKGALFNLFGCLPPPHFEGGGGGHYVVWN